MNGKPELELLTKTQIVREYNYPLALLETDIKTGKLRTVGPVSGWGGRYYIPRLQVENLIRERSGLPVKQDNAA